MWNTKPTKIITQPFQQYMNRCSHQIKGWCVIVPLDKLYQHLSTYFQIGPEHSALKFVRFLDSNCFIVNWVHTLLAGGLKCCESWSSCYLHLSTTFLRVFSTHFIWKNDSAKLMNMQCHLPRVVRDLFGLYFLHIGKYNIQPFLRAGGTQAENSAKCRQNWLCM